MPFASRVVSPTKIGRGGLEDATGTPLETVVAKSLVGIMRQLSSLLGHADDIFNSLLVENERIMKRSEKIKHRIEELDMHVEKFEPKTEKCERDLSRALVHVVHPSGDNSFDAALFTPDTRPTAVQQAYTVCVPTPIPVIRACHATNDLDDDDTWSGSRIFSPQVVMEMGENKASLLSIKTKPPISCSTALQQQPLLHHQQQLRGSCRPVRSARRRPHSITGITDLDISTGRQTVPLPTPEERLREISRSQPVTLVPIDVTGTPFCRQASWRESIRSSSREYLDCSEEHMGGSLPRSRVRRRRTVAGAQDLFDAPPLAGGREPFCVRSAHDLRTRNASRERWTRQSCLIIDTYAPRRGRELERRKSGACRDDSPQAVRRTCSLRASMRSLFARSAPKKPVDLWAQGRPQSPAASLTNLTPHKRPALKRSKSLPRSLKSWLRTSTERLTHRSSVALETSQPLHEVEDEDEGYSGEDDLEMTQQNSFKMTRHSRSVSASARRPKPLKSKAKRIYPPFVNKEGVILTEKTLNDVRLREYSENDRQSSSGHWSCSTESAKDSESPQHRAIPQHESEDKDSALSLNGQSSSTCTSTCASEIENPDSNQDCIAADEASTIHGDNSTVIGDMSTLNGDDEDSMRLTSGGGGESMWISVEDKQHPPRSAEDAARAGTSGALTLQALREHDIALLTPLRSLPDDQESAYSVDAEGFYSTMHTDTGVRRGPRHRPPASKASQGSSSSVGSSTVGRQRSLMGRIPGLRKLTGGKDKELKSPPTPPLRQSSTSLSKDSNVSARSSMSSFNALLASSGLSSPGLPLFESSKHSSPICGLQRTPSVETIGSLTGEDQLLQRERSLRRRRAKDNSMSESDCDSTHARLQVKTSISTAVIPAFCAVSPVPSDDEPVMDGFATWPRKIHSPDGAFKKLKIGSSSQGSKGSVSKDENCKRSFKETMCRLNSGGEVDLLAEQYEKSLLLTPTKQSPPVYETIAVKAEQHPLISPSGLVLSTFVSDVTDKHQPKSGNSPTKVPYSGGDTWPRTPKKPKVTPTETNSVSRNDVTTTESGRNTFPRNSGRKQIAATAKNPTPKTLAIAPQHETSSQASSPPQPAPAQLIISSPMSATSVMRENPFKRSLCSPVSPHDLAGFWNKPHGSNMAADDSTTMTSCPPAMECLLEESMRPENQPTFTFALEEDDDESGSLISRSETFDSGVNSLLVSKPIFDSVHAMKHSISFPVEVKDKERGSRVPGSSRSWYDGVGAKKKDGRKDSSPASGRLSFSTYLRRDRRNSGASSTGTQMSGHRRDSNASSMSNGSRGSRVTFASGTNFGSGSDRRSNPSVRVDDDSLSRSSYSDDSRSLSSFGKNSPSKRPTETLILNSPPPVEIKATAEPTKKRMKIANGPLLSAKLSAKQKIGACRTSAKAGDVEMVDVTSQSVRDSASTETKTCRASRPLTLNVCRENPSSELNLQATGRKAAGLRQPSCHHVPPPTISSDNVEDDLVKSRSSSEVEAAETFHNVPAEQVAPIKLNLTIRKQTPSPTPSTKSSSGLPRTLPRYRDVSSNSSSKKAASRGMSKSESVNSLNKRSDGVSTPVSTRPSQCLSKSKSSTSLAGSSLSLNASSALAGSTGALAGISNTLGGSSLSLRRSNDSLASTSSSHVENNRAAKLAFLAEANKRLEEDEDCAVSQFRILKRYSSSAASDLQNSFVSPPLNYKAEYDATRRKSSDSGESSFGIARRLSSQSSTVSNSSNKSSPTPGRFVTSVIKQLRRKSSVEESPPPKSTTSLDASSCQASSTTVSNSNTSVYSYRVLKAVPTDSVKQKELKGEVCPAVKRPSDPYAKLSILHQKKPTNESHLPNGSSDFKSLLRSHRSNLKSFREISRPKEAVSKS